MLNTFRRRTSGLFARHDSRRGSVRSSYRASFQTVSIWRRTCTYTADKWTSLFSFRCNVCCDDARLTSVVLQKSKTEQPESRSQPRPVCWRASRWLGKLKDRAAFTALTYFRSFHINLVHNGEGSRIDGRHYCNAIKHHLSSSLTKLRSVRSNQHMRTSTLPMPRD